MSVYWRIQPRDNIQRPTKQNTKKRKRFCKWKNAQQVNDHLLQWRYKYWKFGFKIQFGPLRQNKPSYTKLF